jgi:hypothetical protein
MKAILFAFVVIAALLIIAGGVWVAIALIAAILPPGARPGPPKPRRQQDSPDIARNP